MSNLIDTLFGKRKKQSQENQSNGMTKAISVIAAILLWMYVMGEINPEIDKEIMNVNLDYTQVASLEADGLVVINQLPEEISVTVKGRRSEVLGITADDINAQVDLSGYNAGEVKVPVSVSIPKNISLLEVNPLFAEVTIDQLIHQQKPISAIYSGDTASGYLTGSIKYEVSEILVTGPKSKVDLVDRLEVNVNIDNATGDIFTTLPVIPLDVNGMEVLEITVEEQYVDITLPVYPYSRVPVEVDVNVEVEDGYILVSDIKIPAKVDVIGAESIVRNLEKIEAEPIVVENANETIEMPIEFIVPEGSQIVGLKSEPRVKIFIEEKISKEFSLSYNNLEIANLAEGQSLELTDEKIQVIFTGPKSFVDLIAEDEITLKIDVDGLLAGQYTNISTKVELDNISDLIEIKGGKVSFAIK